MSVQLTLDDCWCYFVSICLLHLLKLSFGLFLSSDLVILRPFLIFSFHIFQSAHRNLLALYFCDKLCMAWSWHHKTAHVDRTKPMAKCSNSICNTSVFCRICPDVRRLPVDQSFAGTLSIQLSHGIISKSGITYVVLLLILDVYHLFTLLALSDVTAAIGLVEIDSVDREEFMAVAAFLRLWALLHFQLVFQIIANTVLNQFKRISPLGRTMKSKTRLIKLNIKKEIVSPNECYFLLLFNKIIQVMISDNLEDVRGWSQGQEAVSDQSILNNLLRRKITVDNLPRLNKGVAKSCSPKLFAQTRASCLHKPSNPERNTPTKTLKNKGKYSQRSNQSIDAKYPLKQKLLEILDEEDENILSPTQSAKKIQTVPQQAASFFPPHNSHSQSKLTHHQKMQPQGNRNKTIYEKWQQKKLTSIFKRYDIENRMKPPSLASKLESKTYQLKLNTIDQCPKKKRFFEAFGQDYSDHYEDSLLTVEQTSKRQKKLSTKLERIQRASERMKQTFVKQDMIDRLKKRKEKVQKLQEPAQFNDQQIFNINLTHKMPPACPSQPKKPKVLKLSTLKTTIRYKLLLY